MEMKSVPVLAVLLAGIGLLLLSDAWILFLQARQSVDFQTVRGNLESSQKALVTFPVWDWKVVVVFSVASACLGGVFGVWLASKKR